MEERGSQCLLHEKNLRKMFAQAQGVISSEIISPWKHAERFFQQHELVPNYSPPEASRWISLLYSVQESLN